MHIMAAMASYIAICADTCPGTDMTANISLQPKPLQAVSTKENRMEKQMENEIKATIYM